MRLRLLPLLLLGLLVAAPLASAQHAGAVILRLPPPADAMVPGQQLELQGVAELHADATARASLAGIPVHYVVTAAPSWLQVFVTPPDDVFPPTMFSGSPTAYVSTIPLHLTLLAAPGLDAQGSLVDQVEITATTSETFGTLTGKMTIPVMLNTGQAPCSAQLATQDAGVTPIETHPTLALVALGSVVFVVALLAVRASPRAAIAVGLLLLGAAVPMAEAQRTGSISFSPLSVPMLAPDHAVNATGAVTLITDATAYSSLNGIPVMYHVVRAPAWAVAVVSPSEDIFEPSGLGLTFQSTRPIRVDILVGDVNFTGDVSGQVEIAATAVGMGGAFTGRIVFPVSIHAEPRCPAAPGATSELQQVALKQAALAASAKASAPRHDAPPSPSDSAPLTVQSTAASIRPPTALIVGGFAVAGALVGLFLARRRSS